MTLFFMFISTATELLLKSKIAEICPFLLITGSPRNWPKRCESKDTDFSGNIEKHFRDYTLDINRSFINQAFEALNDRDFVDFLQSRGSTVEQVKERMAGYSETTTCKK